MALSFGEVDLARSSHGEIRRRGPLEGVHWVIDFEGGDQTALATTRGLHDQESRRARLGHDRRGVFTITVRLLHDECDPHPFLVVVRRSA